MANVVVCCRFRPPSRNERESNSPIVGSAANLQTAKLNTGKAQPEIFNFGNFLSSPTHHQPHTHHRTVAIISLMLCINRRFIRIDYVFDVGSTQEEVFDHTAKHLIPEVFGGYNATIFAC
jgi:hypothetical protein